ncbi:hypothetical protein HAX54_046504, partial [Datura stramonium]|nr:hypothetical protein [Datura stramonium]
NLAKYNGVELLPKQYHCSGSIFAVVRPRRRLSNRCSGTLNGVRSAQAVQSSMFLVMY